MRVPENPPRVSTIKTFPAAGPWKSKSGGNLSVLCKLPIDVMNDCFFNYNPSDLAEVPGDLRGFRTYTVRGMPKGGVGGTEFHVIRQEIVLGLEGSCLWTCEDLYGEKREFVVNPSAGIWVPPYTMHTVNVLEENTGFLIIANTLFNPDDQLTHDSYPREVFEDLKVLIARIPRT